MSRTVMSGTGKGRTGVKRWSWKSILLPVAFATAVLALWYLTSAFLLAPSKRFILPMPHEILVVAFLDPNNFGDLLRQLGTTAVVAMTGLAIATVIGITTAVLMSQAKWVETTLYPYAVALQSVPILALVPLIAFALGYGFGSRILVVILISLFPIITNTLFGLHSANAQMKDLFRLKRASRWTILWRLQFPAALPALFTGLRISAGMAVVGAIVADFFFRQGNSGIGLAIDTYRNRLDGEMLYGAILLASFFGLAVFWLFGVLSRLVVGSWYQPESR
ncbi:MULTISPECIES: ABC transporter permease [Microbacterium]|uniref:ABC transporter permease n=1 Tax=Microbacterium TaxID=33882 RepID=UPI0018E1EB93|nr:MULTISPECIES: ABC transporter permease [Microbacterium]MDO8382891.1 ABC transporter permease [Microbacterium sp.]